MLEKLAWLGQKLTEWDKETRQSCKQRKLNLTSQLQQLNEDDPDEEVLEEIMNVKLALNMEADREELYWEQRAGQNWIKMGNRNTSFFHNIATQRKKRNSVKGLENDNGEWVEGEREL